MPKTPPIATADIAPAELERFRISDRHQIDRILRDLARRGDPVTLYYDSGQDSVLTSLVHVDPEQGKAYLAVGADEDANQRLLATGLVLFVAHHKGAPIQFSADEVTAAQQGGSPVFVLPFPRSLIRIQRRELYRISIPVAEPLVCHIDLGERQIRATVVDISLGGVGLIAPETAQEFGFQLGDILPRCRIEIPNEGPIETAIEIGSHVEVATHAGGSQRRVGCRFLDLDPRMNAAIQRYIHRVELERHWARSNR